MRLDCQNLQEKERLVALVLHKMVSKQHLLPNHPFWLVVA